MSYPNSIAGITPGDYYDPGGKMLEEMERLQAENEKQAAFIAAFEEHLETEKSAAKAYARRNKHEIGSADEWHVMTNLSIKHNELKAEHLEAKVAK